MVFYREILFMKNLISWNRNKKKYFRIFDFSATFAFEEFFEGYAMHGRIKQ